VCVCVAVVAFITGGGTSTTGDRRYGACYHQRKQFVTLRLHVTRRNICAIRLSERVKNLIYYAVRVLAALLTFGTLYLQQSFLAPV